jgi:hypothetical protein
MAVESTQSLTGISDRDIFWGGDKDGRCAGLTVLPHLCADGLKSLRATHSEAIGTYLGQYRNGFIYETKKLSIYYFVITMCLAKLYV